MHGIVSLLPQPFYAQVEALWDELEADFGLQSIRVTPYPHFSWQIAEDYELEGLERILKGVASTREPFTARTAGLGIFTGPRPVIFLALVKTSPLMSLHAELWNLTQPVGRGISSNYNLENWMPHISLAYQDVAPHNIAGAMNKLASRSLAWEMTIDNLAFIYEPSGQTGTLKYQVQFS